MISIRVSIFTFGLLLWGLGIWSDDPLPTFYLICIGAVLMVTAAGVLAKRKGKG